ncbi:MAG: ribonuclease HII [Methylococcales bacterium]|nr:ribonuclease HII [Methylococcales bacterium]
MTLLRAGIDEVGRGCLAGPVLAAAVILPEQYDLPGLTDSKKLSPRRRELLATAIQQQAIAWGLGRAEVSEIDRINIRNAALLAMRRALSALEPKADCYCVDGRDLPSAQIPGQAVVGGDGLIAEISAASIVAKVYRDHEISLLDQLYPGYEFCRHKGYGTTLHLAKLAELGPSPAHRVSFKPVRSVSF